MLTTEKKWKFATKMILKTISYKPLHRCVNIVKNAFSYAISSFFHRYTGYGMPFTASIEPANYCNLRCRQCPTGLGMITKERELLTLSNFKRILDAMLPELMYVNLFFQGEPLLNNDIPEMVEYATNHGVATCISTNGHFLSTQMTNRLKKAGLDKLIVSIDGADSESYSKYRQGGRFETVIQGIKNAVKSGIDVELQCLLLSTTEHRMDEIQKTGRELGVKKVIFKTAQFYSIDSLMPENNSLSRYKKDSLELKNGIKNRCWRIISSVVINTTGEVLPCCYDKDCTYSFGNLLHNTNKNAFRGIWDSQKAFEFKNKVFSNRASIKICTNCTE